MVSGPKINVQNKKEKEEQENINRKIINSGINDAFRKIDRTYRGCNIFQPHVCDGKWNIRGSMEIL